MYSIELVALPHGYWAAHCAELGIGLKAPERSVALARMGGFLQNKAAIQNPDTSTYCPDNPEHPGKSSPEREQTRRDFYKIPTPGYYPYLNGN